MKVNECGIWFVVENPTPLEQLDDIDDLCEDAFGFEWLREYVKDNR